LAIVRTDEWLVNSSGKLDQLCNKLVALFPKATSREIFFHLTNHGMYRSNTGAKEIVEQMKKKRIWEAVAERYKKLKERWKGPDIPVFIFPADWRNGRLQAEFNGKGGLAYKDKLFLFLLPHHSNEEIEALLTHEYSHVCRMEKLKKNEEEATLLDAMVFEGLAEYAVGVYVGKAYQANWTTYYTEKQIEVFWRRYLSPNLLITRDDPWYNRLLYGAGFYPKMLGYAVGLELINRCLKGKNVRFERLMSLSAEKIVQIAGFSK